MSDGSTGRPVSGPRPLPSAEMQPETPRLVSAGYCAECGTWDAHGPSCSACGYDFGGDGEMSTGD